MRYIFIILAFFLHSFSFSKDALLIGMSDYLLAPLNNPKTDVILLKNVLEEKGWNVTVLENLDSNNLKAKVKRFMTTEGKNNEPLLLYFSGHGFQYLAENYLIID